MKAWLVSLLRRWLSRLDPPAEAPAEDVPQQPAPLAGVVEAEAKKDIGPVLDHVRALVTWAETQDASGEWRRHQVYARLQKAFPKRSKDLFGLLIELAIREAKYGVDLGGMARSIVGKR